MKMAEAFKPSILLSETHFHSRTAKGVTADAVARVADEGFYQGVGIAEIAHPADRRRIGDIVRSYNLTLTQWLSMALATENLNLSSLDETERSESVARIKDYIGQAQECAAGNIGVCSGPDPVRAFRRKATESFRKSLCELGRELSAAGDMGLLLEPLDREKDKKGLIGPTKEAVALVERVRESSPRVSISWDTSHMLLLGEDLVESLGAVRECLGEIHLANPVLDRDHKDFGDRHISLGAPGPVDVEVIALIFRKAVELGIFAARTPCVAVEIRAPHGADPWETETLGHKALCEAWERFQSERP